jgi:hypothetical protein
VRNESKKNKTNDFNTSGEAELSRRSTI